MSAFREGDIVSMQGTIAQVCDGAANMIVRLKETGWTRTFHEKELTLVERPPAPIKVGERFRPKDCPNVEGTIVAVHEGVGMIAHDGGGYSIVIPENIDKFWERI